MFYKVIVLTQSDLKNLAWDLVSLAEDLETQVSYDFIRDELESILENENADAFLIENGTDKCPSHYYISSEDLAYDLLEYMKEHKLLEV